MTVAKAPRLSNVLSLVLDWAKAKATLVAAKPEEASLRARVVESVFGKPAQGTHYHDLGGGRRLKLELSPRAKVDQAKLKPAIAALEATGELGSHLAGELVKWEGEVRIGAWKKLTEEQRALFDGVVSIVDGSPSLELLEEQPIR